MEIKSLQLCIANASSLHSVKGSTFPFKGLAIISFFNKAGCAGVAVSAGIADAEDPVGLTATIVESLKKAKTAHNLLQLRRGNKRFVTLDIYNDIGVASTA